ncbi:hypothetical protein LP52_11785 [Streptomonospora alba]|uniref:Uncharacterized protein n=1 Tax=Streptomonospora alba TaxID=183763 RepID=A0A0C2JB45_9ACTN|nr:hypothetical protein [Streptomonospora alba]KIH98631.1 hypothetical protein LP52_11785 [Streptomonospora alba]
MGTRRNWIERKARQVMGGRLDGMGGGSPVSRTHRPHLKGGAVQARGLGGTFRRTLNRGMSTGSGAGKRHGGGMQRGIRKAETRLRRAIRR